MQSLNTLVYYQLKTVFTCQLLTFCFLLLLCLPLGAQDWELVYEQGICRQSFAASESGNINQVARVYAEGFRLRSRGSSGRKTDLAAWSTNTTTAYIQFSHTYLSDDYEYRVRLVAKSSSVEKTLAFALVDENDRSHLISDQHQVAVVSSVTEAGTMITSAAFTHKAILGEEGAIQAATIRILPRGDSPGDWVMIDDYVLERRLLPATEPLPLTVVEDVKDGTAFTNSDINLYPNPFYSAIHLDTKVDKAFSAEIVIINTQGQSVLQQPVYFEAGDNSIELLGAADLEPGIYIVTILKGGEVKAVGRLVKM